MQLIRSDNGTNIVGAQRELRKEIQNWNQAKISDALLQRNIEWKFNPPGASYFGGVWERQIRTIRKLMCALLKQQTLTDESLQTLFCEIEAIINSRPLTCVSSDPNDIEPLTPNHLLLMKNHQNLPPVTSEFSGACIRRSWRQVQYLADVFWRPWLKEYLVQLQVRQKWATPQANIKVGDIVLIVNEAAPRNLWQMGREIETPPDKQGQVRQAKLQTNTNIKLRPIHKLCLLLESDIPDQIAHQKPTKSPTDTDSGEERDDVTYTKKTRAVKNKKAVVQPTSEKPKSVKIQLPATLSNDDIRNKNAPKCTDHSDLSRKKQTSTPGVSSQNSKNRKSTQCCTSKRNQTRTSTVKPRPRLDL